ncbi:protocadherin gamma-C5-like [Micropterus dolomieu]|uniref:protocadherin gamma-C5-like n=1 Tax=Micropterus dolomieu TaxID=147949 RepID=UPI001E8E2517|nr:protocadherin gamma-C5-like [Micropterus dolomieu]
MCSSEAGYVTIPRWEKTYSNGSGITKRMGYRDWRWLALWWHHFFLFWSTTDGQTRYSIPEELKQGSVVGNLAKDLGLGLSDIFDRKLRVASEAGEQYFSVDAGKGELVVNDRIDREALCGQSASCVLPLQVVIENPLHLYRIEVEIRDVNDNSPSFLSKERNLKIAELTAVGARYPLETAQDLDVGSNSLKSYSLSKDECFSLKIKELANGRKVPELVLEKPLDREKQNVHQLLLTALDGGNPVKTGTSKITVTVLDNNDNVPVFKHALYKITLPENSQSGFMLVKVEATDADEGVNGEIEYSFAEHTPDVLLSIFQINSATGEVFLKGQLDYETVATHEIDITAKDKGIPEMEGHCRVQVEVIDINDNAPEIVLTSKPSHVPEDAPSGTVVALLTARDLDSSDNGKVTLQLTKDSPLTLKPSFSNNYALVTKGGLDRERFSQYSIEITATDLGSPPLSCKKTINVSITDVNDNPPVFTQPSYNVYLKENGVPGSILYSVSASDLDFGENAKISYSILDSKVQDVSVSSYVYINSDNGSIYSMHSFDYEKLKVFQIQVQAKDQGSPSLSSNATVHVFILDQNDNAPAVIYPSSAALGSLSHQRMPRSAKAGHLVTKVTAVDADSGHNAWISYRLAEATDASLFTVNLYTGEVRTKRAASEQDDSSQRLLIEIKDDGEPVQSSTVTVSILLEDGLHEPILDLRQKAAEPSKKTGRITLYLILSLASVSVLSLLTFLILAVKCIRNSRSSGSCCTRRSDCDDYKNPNRNLQIQLNTDGPIKYVEVLGGDMLSQSQSFRSCMSPMSEYSDFTLIKPSSTTDFKEVISVLDASLPDSTWTFESQQPSYNVYLKENGVPGSILYSVSASDLDFGENAKISYSILDSKVQDVSVSSYVYINSDNGSIYSMHSFDYEKLKVFQIQVQAKDQGSPSLSSNATVHRLLIEIKDDGEPVQSSTVTVSILLEDGLHEPILDLRQKAAEPSKKTGRITLYLILSLASVSVLSLLTFLILAVKCIRNSRSSGSCCTRRSDCDDYKNPNRNLQIQLNTDGPIKYVEVLGGDMLSQSQSFRSCMSPMSEYSDFTLIKPSSTTDFKEVISVLDASLPDSTWTFESQQVSRKQQGNM